MKDLVIYVFFPFNFQHLRSVGVVGKFVEFFGPGVAELSIADRATISNMCPEYGATVGFFPVDDKSLGYLRQTGREESKIELIEQYLKVNKMFRDFTNADQDPVFSTVIELDLSTVMPCCSGPKRPHDKVPVAEMKTDFTQCLSNKAGFKVSLTLSQISPGFTCLIVQVFCTNLLKTLWEKEKLLLKSNFSFFNCFLCFQITFCHFHQN